MPNGGKRPGAGRKPDPTKQAIAEAYTKALAEAVEKNYGKIIAALMTKAKSGDMQAIKEIHERLLGKVKEQLDVTSKGESITGFNYIAPHGSDYHTNP